MVVVMINNQHYSSPYYNCW